jgi:hypothetical protein
MPLTAGQHEPTDACNDIHCYSHMVDELGPGYLACLECGHMYRTAGELRRAYRAALWRTWHDHRRLFGPDFGSGLAATLWRMATVRASKIYFCQHCLHDF